MLETKTGVFFIAGLGFFAVAFLSNAVLPIMMYRHLPEQSVEQMLEHNGNLRLPVRRPGTAVSGEFYGSLWPAAAGAGSAREMAER